MKNETKKRILIVVIILIITLGVIGTINFIFNYPQYEKNKLPSEVKTFFNNNKNVLNEFVKLCHDNEIDYIGENESSSHKDMQICEMNGYNVYSKDDLSDLIKGNLLKELKIFKQNSISEIFVEEDHVSIVITKSLTQL